MNLKKVIFDLALHEKKLYYDEELTQQEKIYLDENINEADNYSIMDIEYIVNEFVDYVKVNKIIVELEELKNKDNSQHCCRDINELIYHLNNNAGRDLISLIVKVIGGDVKNIFCKYQLDGITIN